MPAIQPAAAAVAAVAAEGVRPVASKLTRVIFATGAGFATAAGIGYWADKHYDTMPDADGTSAGRIDRAEARKIFSGPEGWPAIVSFSALMSVSVLYSQLRDHITPGEFSMLRYGGYAFLGGMLVGTAVTPGLLPALPSAGR